MTELGLTRETRASFDGGSGDERDFERDDFARLERKISDDKRAIIGSVDAKFVMAGRDGENAEDAFATGGAGECLAALQIAESELSAGNGNGGAGRARVAHDAVESGCVLRLLAGDAKRLCVRVAGLLGGGLLPGGLARIARVGWNG